MLSVRDVLRRAAGWNRDRLAIVSGDRRLTFGEAWERGLRMANALLALGLKSGDRVGVLEENSIEASDFFLGAAAANLVRVPLYKKNAPEAHAHMISHTSCRAIVVAAEYLDEIEGVRDRCPDLEHVIVRGDDYEAWLATFPATDPNPVISPDDLYIIRHSGGTTGLPKGMAFSHKNWLSTERDWTYRLPPIEVGDGCVHVGPISHGSGYFFMPVWVCGGYNVLVPKFNAAHALDLLQEHGGYFFAVPTIISDMLAVRDAHTRRFDKLKAIVVSGAPIRPQAALAAHELFGDTLHQLYGQTECTPVGWLTPKEWFQPVEGSDPLSSVGKVMPFAQVEIRDETNQPLGIDRVGEVAIQNDGQIDMIWRAPELTAQRLVDGWVLTGDIGRIDTNGYLYLVDRKDDMIISGGLNIWPAELEIVIAALPEVREVAVVPAPHKRWGETPIAIVVLHEGATLTEEAVVAVCADRLGVLKRPSQVVFREELLPRTPVGKLERKVLREPFWEGKTGRIGGA